VTVNITTVIFAVGRRSFGRPSIKIRTPILASILEQ
jgi:hypothetical protein